MNPESHKAKIKIAAVGDLHVHEHHFQPYRELFETVPEVADILLLCGDLTNTGLPKEAENLAFSLATCKIPVVGVLGNHDYQSDSVDEVKKILSQAKFKFLDDEIFLLRGVGFAGVKGFGGGFEKYMLGSFGEEATKIYVSESVNEALKLENALKQLESDDVDNKIVVLHYSPIRETILGEPEEIYPYLGSSRLAEVIDRFENVKLVVHGHAHHAAHSGKTAKDVPVYNVAFEVLKRSNIGQFLVIEV